MKILFGVIVMLAICMFFPALLGLVGLGGLVYYFVAPKTNKKKMTKAQKRKAFNKDIMYY